MRTKIEHLQVRADSRGISFDAVEPGELGTWGAMHAVATLPGHVRGNHLHADADELLVVVGPALVRFREERETHAVEVSEGEVIRCRIPRGVSHAVLARGNSPQFVISLYSAASPQTARDVLIEAGEAF